MKHPWAHSVLDGLAKPVLLSLFSTRACIVDVACASCGEELAMVTEAANGPTLTVWAPTGAPAAPGGEPLWAMATGPVPDAAVIPVQCFAHGHGVVDSTLLREVVGRYRDHGARQRLPVDVQSTGAGPQRLPA